jgi:hypothetical protein
VERAGMLFCCVILLNAAAARARRSQSQQGSSDAGGRRVSQLLRAGADLVVTDFSQLRFSKDNLSLCTCAPLRQ